MVNGLMNYEWFFEYLVLSKGKGNLTRVFLHLLKNRAKQNISSFQTAMLIFSACMPVWITYAIKFEAANNKD